MNALRILFKTAYQSSLLRFIIVGAGNTLVDFAVFFALYLYLGMWFVLANVISFSVAVTHSYALNKYWSFRRRTNATPATSGEFILFITVSVVALCFGTGVLVVGEPYLPIFALKIIGAFITPLINYFAYRFLVFRPSVSQ